MNFNELFIYDARTGHLFSKIKRGKLLPKQRVGYQNNLGYVVVGVGRRKYLLAHRIIWEMLYGPIPDTLCIDHINGIPNDNRLSNLRLVTRQQNQCNMKLPKSNTSGVIGVYWYKPYKKWSASIQVCRKQIKLGYFASIDEAIQARKDAEILYGFHPNHGRT